MAASLESHFIFGLSSAFSHNPPAINLAVSLLTLTPDLCISVILHKNNEENSRRIISLVPPGVIDRLKLYPLGELEDANDVSTTTMTVAYKSGKAYAEILMVIANAFITFKNNAERPRQGERMACSGCIHLRYHSFLLCPGEGRRRIENSGCQAVQDRSI